MATIGDFVYNHMISIQDEKNQILTTNIWLNLVRKHSVGTASDMQAMFYIVQNGWHNLYRELLLFKVQNTSIIGGINAYERKCGQF